MISTCDKCFTSFRIDKNLIGPLSRKVKCSKCSHIWTLKLPEVDFKIHENEEQKNLPKQNFKINLPMVPDHKNAKIWKFGIILQVLLIFCIILWSNLDSKTYCKYGFCNFENIIIDDFKIKLTQNRGQVNVRYLIVNKSQIDQKMPYTKIALYDKSGKEIKSEILPRIKSTIPKMTNSTIDINIKQIPQNAIICKVFIGNWMDLKLSS